ncbi:MAG: dTMP kinase [Propionibacteriaceae bacterium]
MSGLFVVFEGGDGVGKSTQVGRLVDWLVAEGYAVVRTFEPGDSAAGQQIRHLLLDPATGDLAPRAEALLYAADKAHHVQTVIRPALARGAVVVCDRYVDSMLAYQGAGRVLVHDEVERIARWATEELRPDLTVLLDVEPHRAVGEKVELDRLEAAGADFHLNARASFLALAARDPGGYLVLDARDDRDVIAAAVRDRLRPVLPDLPAPPPERT